MNQSLIERLDAMPKVWTPDQILTSLHDPLPRWTQGQSITEHFLDVNGQLRIVICSSRYRDNPCGNVEEDHKLSSGGDWGYNHWILRDYQTGVLRGGGNFWFRSLKSYKDNMYEGF